MDSEAVAAYGNDGVWVVKAYGKTTSKKLPQPSSQSKTNKVLTRVIGPIGGRR